MLRTVVTTLAVVLLTTASVSDGASPTGDARWEPDWLELLVVVAVVLVVLAVAWWLLLVVRVQDRFRDESAVRRRR